MDLYTDLDMAIREQEAWFNLLQDLKILDVKTYNSIISDGKKFEGTKAFNYIAQGILQDAIAAKRWYMRIFQRGNYNPFNGKFIDEPSLGYEADVGPIDDFESVSGSTPARALLAAYVEALKIEKKREISA